MERARWIAGAVALVIAALPAGPSPIAEAAVVMDRGHQAAEGPRDPAPRAASATGWATQRTLMAWSPGKLPAGFADRVRSSRALEHVVLVRSNTLDLLASFDGSGALVDRAPGGLAYPLEVFSINASAYRRLIAVGSRAPFERLTSRTALLSRTSARVRDIGVGGRLRLRGGHTLRVAGLVDDALVGGAELVVNRRAGRRLGVTRQRYVLARLVGTRREARSDVRRAAGSYPSGTRMPGEVPILRDAAGVAPQAWVKAAFGEFPYRTGSGLAVTLGRSWVRRNIVTATVPILGSVRCHRRAIAPLRGALREVRERGLSSHINAGDYAGCYAPRMSSTTARLSRHAWGIAADLNASSNRFGTRGNMDPRVVAIFAEHGFGWGGGWLLPDPMHFELHPPRP